MSTQRSGPVKIHCDTHVTSGSFSEWVREMIKSKGGLPFPHNKPLTQQRAKSPTKRKQPTKKPPKKSPKSMGLSFLWKKGETWLLVFILWIGGEYFLNFDGDWSLSNRMIFQKVYSHLLVYQDLILTWKWQEKKTQIVWIKKVLANPRMGMESVLNIAWTLL